MYIFPHAAQNKDDAWWDCACSFAACLFVNVVFVRLQTVL